MFTLPAAAQLHLARESRRITICGEIYKTDGTVLRCTQHDEDVEIESGDFEGIYYATQAVTGSAVKAGSDLSVDNMEIEGVIADSLDFGGFSVADIEAGLFNRAPFQTFLCQWDNPSAWQKPIRRGFLGKISRTAEGQFTAEWRGLLQLMQQNVGRTYSETCDVVRFGDARCALNVDALEQDGTVTAVTSRRLFDLDTAAHTFGYFDLGEVLGLTGANAGIRRLIKREVAGSPAGAIETWDSFPYNIQVGDTFRLRPGCDRRFETCQGFANTLNFRGHGRWIPGIPNIIRAP